MAVEDNFPKKECSPLHLADEIWVQREEVEERQKKKKSQSNYCDPEEIWRLSRWCVRSRLNGTVAEKGKGIIDSNYTGLQFSALCVTGLSSVLSL